MNHFHATIIDPNTYEDLPDVRIIGRGTTFKPIKSEQWDAITEATAILAKAGLSIAITNFWSASEPERTEIINKRYTDQGQNQSIR